MRSRPYSPPPPLPPLLSELSTYLPNREPLKDSHRHRRASEDAALPLADLDPETCRLLPPQQRKRSTHHVRIQGKLAPVRSVSVVNLRSKSVDHRATATSSLRDEARFVDAAVGGTVVARKSRRRRSEDGASSETDEEVRERDTQLRGYGIGGAGNIRRATDVIGTSSRASSLSLSSLFSSSGSTTSSSPGPDRRWRISGLLDRIEERRSRDKRR